MLSTYFEFFEEFPAISSPSIIVGRSAKGSSSIVHGTNPSLAPTWATILLTTLLKPLSFYMVLTKIIYEGTGSSLIINHFILS